MPGSLLLLLLWELGGSSLIRGQAAPLGQVPAPGHVSPAGQVPPTGQASSPAQAAPTGTGTVTGHIRGPGGVSVPGATVQLTNPKTGERKETWTDLAGNYTFTGLAPGNYRLDVSLVGFRSDSREPIPVTPGNTLKVNVAMVFASPEGTSQEEAQAAKRPAGNHPELPLSRNSRGGNPSNNSVADESGLRPKRIVANRGGQWRGRASSSRGAQPEEADNSTSANNSFLLGGGIGEAATPGEGDSVAAEAAAGWAALAAAGGGGGGGGGPFGGGGPGGGGLAEVAADSVVGWWIWRRRRSARLVTQSRRSESHSRQLYRAIHQLGV